MSIWYKGQALGVFWGSRVDLQGEKEQQGITFPISGSHEGRK